MNFSLNFHEIIYVKFQLFNHFVALVSFYTPWKQKSYGFLFSGGIEGISAIKWVNSFIQIFTMCFFWKDARSVFFKYFWNAAKNKIFRGNFFKLNWSSKPGVKSNHIFLIHLKTAKKVTNQEQFCNNAVSCLNSSLGSWFSPKKRSQEKCSREIIFFEVYQIMKKYHFMLNYLVP